MRDLDVIDERMATAKFIFGKEFSGFKGHFNGNPVLPGVCKILAAVEMIKVWKGQEDLELKEVDSAKFFMPVTCSEELMFKCVDNGNSEGLSISILIARGEEKISKLKLKF